MAQPVWNCKCCSVTFSEFVDFEKHRVECINRGKACVRCTERFTEVGMGFHLINSTCGLRHYDVKDLHTWATEVNDRRINVIVKDYHKRILDAVTNGKFTIRLHFIYPDDSQLVRADSLSRMVSELKKLFTNVEITPDHLGTFIDVSWNKVAFCDDDLPDSLKTLPEKVNDTKKDDDTLPEKNDELYAKLKDDMKKVMKRNRSKKLLSSLNLEYEPEYEERINAMVEKYVSSYRLPVNDQEEDE